MAKNEIYKSAKNGLQIDEGDGYLSLMDCLTSSEQHISHIQDGNKIKQYINNI